MQVRWHGGFNASAMAAAKAKSRCHEIRQQQLLAGDYDLDYSTDSLGEPEDPCEEAVKQARQVALLSAAEWKESQEAEKKVKAGAQQPAGGPCYGREFLSRRNQHQAGPPCMCPICPCRQQVLHAALQKPVLRLSINGCALATRVLPSETASSALACCCPCCRYGRTGVQLPQGRSLSCAGGVKVRVAGAGTGEVQKRPEGWVLPHETLPADVLVRLRPC